jgi:hypothetical protein
MNLNPLNPVWKAYQVSIECLDIANEVIKQQKANWFHSQWLNQLETRPIYLTY